MNCEHEIGAIAETLRVIEDLLALKRNRIFIQAERVLMYYS